VTGHCRVVIDLRLPPGRDAAAACRESAEAAAAGWGTELGLPEPAVLDIQSGSASEVPEVEVRGISLPVSARRAEQALAVVTGRFASPEVDEAARSRLGSLWRSQPDRRPALVANWLDAALRASTKELRPLVGASRLDQGSPGPDSAPVVELPEPDLRLLTSGPGKSLNTLAAGFTTAIFQQYGVTVPGIRLAFGPPGLFRFSFQGLRTPAYLLPEDRTVIVQQHPELLVDVHPAGSVLDPVTGARWTLLREVDAAGLDPRRVLDRLGYMLRALQAECLVRLTLWAPATVDAYRSGLWQEPELAERVGSFLPELTSRLVAERASGQYVDILVEAVLRVLARGGQSLDDMEDEARRRLGDTLLGELHLMCVPVLMDLDPGTLPPCTGEEAGGLRKALLARFPELLHETSPVVVRVPAAARPAVAAALRPLNDVVQVVTREEFEPTPALRARWAAMGHRPSGEANTEGDGHYQ
jgi:hypothetical protein